MKTVHTPLHIGAAIAGIACTATEVVSNIDHIVHSTKTLYDPAVAAVAVTSIGVTFAMACVYRAFRDRQVLTGIMLLLAFLTGAGYTLSTTLERVAAHRDTKLEKIWSADLEIQRLTKVRDQMNYTATRERVEGNKGKNRQAGEGQSYNAARAEAQIASDLLSARKAELDSMGKRISAITFGRVSVETASMFQPMLLPVALFLMGSYFVAFGLAGTKVKPEFEVELTGRAAADDKAKRFANQFKQTHGRLPSPAEIEKAIGVSQFIARRLTRDLKAA